MRRRRSIAIATVSANARGAGGGEEEDRQEQQIQGHAVVISVVEALETRSKYPHCPRATFCHFVSIFVCKRITLKSRSGGDGGTIIQLLEGSRAPLAPLFVE